MQENSEIKNNLDSMGSVTMATLPKTTDDVGSKKVLRQPGIDGLRTLAVLFMIASHTTRLIDWDSRRGWSVFSLLIEPMTASLFLILVGSSLVFAWRAALNKEHGLKSWYRKQCIRALAFWCLSCLFYSLEEGFHWPDAVLMSGILCTIAYASLIGTWIISLRFREIILVILSVGLFGLEVYLDKHHILLFMVNLGNSPLLPLFLFTCLGALGSFGLLSSSKWIKPFLVVLACITLGLIFSRYNFSAVFSKPIGRYESARSIVKVVNGLRVEHTIPYYNLRPILVPVIASLTIMLFAVFQGIFWLGNFFGKKFLGEEGVVYKGFVEVKDFVFLIGRYSLDVYILHLSLLAVLILKWGMRPLGKSWQGDGTYIGIVCLCYAWAWNRDRMRKRKLAKGMRTDLDWNAKLGAKVNEV